MSNIKEIILKNEKAMNERWNKGDYSGFLDCYVDEVTFVDPGVPSMVQSREEIREKLEMNFPYKEFPIVKSEYSNEKVVVSDGEDMAVLTYNLHNSMQSKSGKLLQLPLWHCTQVYQLIQGEWRIIHNHWSFAQVPELMERVQAIFTEAAKED
ncbi:nuclear transport factor 2 family protein [Paenibacillus illinoisensis]|uniref:YybH family protein n=1 Tax=Paenibacillus illinoisensis TaxID=59845 RepID=UPI003D2A0B2B